MDLDDAERREVGRKARAAILAALEALGGEALRGELLERARRAGGFTAPELEAPAPEKAQKQYATFVDYRLSWALSNLKRDGLVENPRWGTWRLTGAAAAPAQSAAVPITAARLAELRAMQERQYLRTPEWRRTRAAALARAGHRCSLDRTHTKDLEVHHNTYERVGAELQTDLVVLCRDCHRLHHKANGRPRRPKTREQAEAARAAASTPPPPQATISRLSAPARPASFLRRLLGA